MQTQPAPVTSLLNIAHRGASAYAPENTIEAFDLAGALGATALEMDVQQTRDGKLVVVHDETIERTLRGSRITNARVSDLTWGEVSRLDAGSWFNDTRPEMHRPEYAGTRVVRLEEVFKRYGDSIMYFIELKHAPCGTGMEAEIVDLVRRHELVGRDEPNAIVAAFSQKCLRIIHELDRRVGLVQLFHSYATSAAIRGYIRALPSYCSGIGAPQEAVDESLVAASRAHDLDVFAWTVNHADGMLDLMGLGVAGLVTDFPDVLDDLIRSERRRLVPTRVTL